MLKLTALLTTYNRAQYLDDVLTSVRGQTCSRDDYELVVIDDGSTDNTASIVQKYCGDLTVRYIHQDNAGLAAARNHGVSVARAPLILMMDDDDIVQPNNFVEHVRSHEAYPAKEIAVLGFTKLRDDIAADPLMHFVTETCPYLFSYQNASENEFLDFHWFWGGRTSFKRNFVLENGGFNPVFRFGCEDIELAYRLKRKGLKVVYNPRAESVMIRKLSFDAFCDRLRRQGNSQFVFSRLCRDHEVQAWCEMDRFFKEWPELACSHASDVNRAKNLDRWAHRSVELGLPLEAGILQQLHESYYRAFISAKLAGIAEVKKSWDDVGVEVIEIGKPDLGHFEQ